MTRLVRLLHLLWPWVEPLSEEEVERRRQRSSTDRTRIDTIDFGSDADVALDEARRMADSEAERRRGTDQKAATYLPLVAALIPLVLTVVGALWEKKAGGAPVWLNMALLALAVAYTAAAGVWAFRVLEVKVSHEFGLGDLETVWRRRHPTRDLVRRIVLYVRLNQDGINQKVTRIKMAHEFLLRAFLMFSFVLFLNILWYFVAWAWAVAKPESDREILTPQRAIVAVASTDRMTEQMRTVDAWTVLDAMCRKLAHGKEGLRLVAADPLATGQIPAKLAPEPGAGGLTLSIRLTCLGRDVGQTRLVYLPKRLNWPRNASYAAFAPLLGTAAEVVSTRQDWPADQLERISTVMPTALVHQTVLLRSGGVPAALLVTHVGPGALPPR